MSVVSSAHFGSNNPREFGWAPASNIAPFTYVYQGARYSFPGGVHRGTERLWRDLLDHIVPRIHGGIHPGGPNVAGTWGYENRHNVNSSGSLSFHAFGLALDLNAPWNPNGAGPQNGPYGMGSWAASIARARGFLSGVEFTDPMHLELHLSPDQVNARIRELGGTPARRPVTPKPAPGTHPTKFPLPAGYYFGPLSGPRQSISGMFASDTAGQRAAIQRIQRKLHIPDDGRYGPSTMARVKAFQTSVHLPADGLCGVNTWKALGL